MRLTISVRQQIKETKMNTTPLPRIHSLEEVLAQLARIGALLPPDDPLELPPFGTHPHFEVSERDFQPLTTSPYTQLAPVPAEPVDWWPGHPEDPYLQEEDLRRSPATELIAWYCGYHHHRPDRWGIYIRERAVIAVTQDLHARMAQKGRCDMTAGEVRNLFFDKVWHHEYFHHLAEAAVTRLELRHGIPLYPRRLQHYRTMRRTGRFMAEEMCANAYAIDRVSAQVFVRPDGHYRSTWGLEALQEWMRHQPPGYNAFDRALGPIHRILALRTLAEDSLPDHPGLHHEFLHDVLNEFAGNGRLYRTGKDAVPLFLVDRL